MPREVLTGPDKADPPDDHRPVVGFFGKLPSTGDFVARGLPDAFRRNWDAWLTREIAPLQRGGASFPTGGLRFQLVSGGRMAAGLILPSQDSIGRLFPLSVILAADGSLAQAEVDDWCDRVLPLVASDKTAPQPDDLWQALDALPAPSPVGPATGPMRLWALDHGPLTTSPDNPGEALRALLA